ncbi:MAG: LysR family transcriptional regulator [Myxococcota bacterium]
MDRLNAYGSFLRVVEAGSFSAAARELGVTQPTISKQIAALEAELETALLVRTTRKLSLTDAGNQLYESARSILDEVARTEAAVRRLDQEPVGTLRVNLPLVFGQECIVPLLPEFLRAHPKIELDLHFTDRYVDLLEEGVDIVVRIGTTPDSTLVARKLGLTRRVVVASPDFLARHGMPQQPGELATRPCVVFASGGSGSRWVFERGGQRSAVRLSSIVRSDNGHVLRDLAVRGVGITTLASWLVAPDIEAGRLVPLLEDYTMPTMDITALYPSRRFLPHRARRFLEFLERRFSGHPQLG